MEKKLLEFIKKEFLEDPDTELNSDTKLISTGLIDSFSLVSLQLLPPSLAKIFRLQR